MANIIGLRQLRENVAEYADLVAKGKSFVVVRQSKPIFKISRWMRKKIGKLLLTLLKLKRRCSIEDIVAAITNGQNTKSSHKSWQNSIGNFDALMVKLMARDFWV